MNVRPLTLHINTGKGTAVVQVQSSQQIPAINTKRTPIHDTFRKVESQPQTSFQNSMSISGASSSAGALNPITYCQSGPSSSSLTVAGQQQAALAAAAAAHSRIFPTSITLPNAAAAAASTYFYQNPLNAFHNLVALQQNVAAMQQNVAAVANCVAKPNTVTNYSAAGPLFNSAAVKYLSPAAPFSHESHPSSNNATSHGAIHSLNRFEMQTSGGAATIGLSNNKAHSSPCHPSFVYQPGTALSTYNHQPAQNFPLGASPSTSISCTTPGQSPRPSILRKRAADSGSAISASASKRLTYESIHSIQAKQTSAAIQRLLDVTGHLTSSDDILGPNMKAAAATLETIESGNSNHSSSTSTISAAGSSMNEPSFPLDYSSSSRQTSTESYNNVAASSSAYLHAALPVISLTSPSPRKRQRKQRLDELPPESVVTNSLAPLFCPQQSQAASSRPPASSKPAPPLDTHSYEYPIVKKMSSSSGKSEHSFSNKNPAMQHMGRCRLPLAPAEMIANDRSKSPTVSLSQPNTKSLIVKTEIKEETLDEAPSVTNSSAETTSDSRSSPIERSKSPHAKLWSGESPWNARRSHFHSAVEIRIKDDSQLSQKSGSEAHNHNRVANLNDLCNHKQINHRLDPWRLHLINLSIEQLEKCQETNVRELQNLFDEHLQGASNASKFDDSRKSEDFPSGQDSHPIHLNLDETILTNLQRCTVVSKKLNEMKGQLKTILTHKVNAENIVQKYCTKRNGRKKTTTKSDI